MTLKSISNSDSTEVITNDAESVTLQSTFSNIYSNNRVSLIC